MIIDNNQKGVKMTNYKTITKVENVAGHYFTCSNCGREIKHAYRIDSNKEVIGSECVKVLVFGKNIKKDLSLADSRMTKLRRYKR